MKKLLSIFLVALLLMFSLAGCTQADDLIQLESLYETYKESFFADDYFTFNSASCNVDLCRFAYVKKDSLMYDFLANREGVVADAIIYATDINVIFAYEFSSVQKAKKAWNNYFRGGDICGMYTLYKNAIALSLNAYKWLIDSPPEYLPTGETVVNGNFLYAAPKNLGSEYVIPSQIETIGSVVLPAGNNVVKINFNKVKHINALAFVADEQLSEVDFGSKLTAIGACAFRQCSKLRTVVIPKNVKYIGREAFIQGTIYVEGYKQRPDGWAEQFAAGDAKVYWAGEWHYDDNGNPTPNN